MVIFAVTHFRATSTVDNRHHCPHGHEFVLMKSVNRSIDVKFNETCHLHVYQFNLFTVKRSINQEQQYNFAQQCHNTEHSTSSLVMQPLYYNKSKHTTCANRYVH